MAALPSAGGVWGTALRPPSVAVGSVTRCWGAVRRIEQHRSGGQVTRVLNGMYTALLKKYPAAAEAGRGAGLVALCRQNYVILRAFVKLARTVRRYAGILVYHTLITNGLVEGLGNSLWVVARHGLGFHLSGALISILFLVRGISYSTGRYQHVYKEIEL